MRKHPITASAEIVNGQTETVLRGLQAYSRRFPVAATHLGIQRSTDGVFARDDLLEAATSAILVRLTAIEPLN